MNPKIHRSTAQGNDQAAEAAPCWACEAPAVAGRYCPDCAEKVEQAKAERVQLEANPRYQAIRNRVRAAMARLYAAQAQAARDRRHAGQAFRRSTRPRPRRPRPRRAQTAATGTDPPSEPEPPALTSPIVAAWFGAWINLAYADAAADADAGAASPTAPQIIAPICAAWFAHFLAQEYPTAEAQADQQSTPYSRQKKGQPLKVATSPKDRSLSPDDRLDICPNPNRGADRRTPKKELKELDDADRRTPTKEAQACRP